MAMALVERGMQSSLSDAGVAAASALACATGAYYNVLINIPEIEDAAYRENTIARRKNFWRRPVEWHPWWKTGSWPN